MKFADKIFSRQSIDEILISELEKSISNMKLRQKNLRESFDDNRPIKKIKIDDGIKDGIKDMDYEMDDGIKDGIKDMDYEMDDDMKNIEINFSKMNLD